MNADNKSYVSSNAKKVLLDVEEKISQYMQELDETDCAESKPGAMTKEDIATTLDYLERGKSSLLKRWQRWKAVKQIKYAPLIRRAES